MPFRDGTGPCGEGPLTGRGLGPCGTGTYPRGAARFGRGFGRGFRGRAFAGRRFARPVSDPYYDYTPQRPLTKDDEEKFFKEDIRDIEQEIKDLEQEKKEIEKRLKDI